ncbi:MAG TPA: response regulator transcription factor, partial [Cytophagaceae bacterium]
EDEKYVSYSFESGALGYILKTTGREELVFAIKKVAAGEPYISHKISHNLISKGSGIRSTPRIESHPELQFSDREFEILNLIAEGFTNSEIADKIFVSKRTVETHRKSLMEKTNTRNTAALIKFTIVNGIIK